MKAIGGSGRKQPQRENCVRFETLEPRNMLTAVTADFGLADPYGSNLLTHIQTDIPVTEQLNVLRDQVDAGANDTFQLIRQDDDQLGFTHYKYQHFFNGIEVEDSTYTVHTRDGLIVSLSGEYHDVNQNAAESATISESDALKYALEHINAEVYIWQDAATQAEFSFHTHEGEEGVIYLDSQNHDHQHQCSGESGCNCADCVGALTQQHSHGHEISFEIPTADLSYQDNRLTYRFDIYAVDPLSRSWIYIDATNGEVIDQRSQIHEVDIPASGTALYDGNVDFTADFTGTDYRLRQTADGVQTFDLNNSTNYNTAVDIVSSSNTFFDSDHEIGVQAHFGSEQTLQYFLTEHGRDSFDGQGTPLVSYVSYSDNLVNAFWNGSFATYGDGNGTTRGPLVSLDVVGHEIAHGVTQFTAGLIYRDQSGALNESFSDIFGEAVENFARGSNDWLIGGDIGLGGNSGQFRNLQFPNLHADPDTYLGDYWFSGNGDNGGVHINSGVQNKWFYILSNGEAGTNDTGHTYNVSGIGIQDAASIAYRNLSTYLTANSTYPDARVGAVQSAIDLFGVGSTQHFATLAAWDAVGVYDLDLELEPLAIQPLGSQVFADSSVNEIAFASDVNEFALNLDSNQAITLAVQNISGDLLPSVTITSPDGSTLANSTATTTSDIILFQSLPATASGQYTITVGGAADTFGLYEIDLLLNADLELEELGFGENDDLISAQDLDNTSLTQGFLASSQVDRLSTIGILGTGGSLVASESFESGTLSGAWTTFSSNSNGRIQVSDDTGTPYGTYALSLDVSSNGFNLNEAILSVDLTGVTEADLTFAHARFGDESHSLPTSFTGSQIGDGVSISDDGITWFTVLTNANPPNGVWRDVQINLIEEATNAGLTLNSDFQIKFQQYDNTSRATDGRAYDNISVGTVGVHDYYSFTLEPGQSASVTATSIDGTPADLNLELFDAAQNSLATGLPGVSVGSYIEHYVNTTGVAETVYVDVSGEAQQYNLLVTRGAAFDLGEGLSQDITEVSGVLGFVSDSLQIDADPDSATSSDDVSTLFPGVTLSNNVTGGSIFAVQSEFTAPTGLNVFGTSSTSDNGFRSGVNELRADFDLAQAFVSIDTGSDDTLDIGYLQAYDVDGNLLEEVIGSGVPHSGSETLSIARGTADIAYILAGGVGIHTTPLDNLVFEEFASDTDVYDIANVVSGDRLEFQAYLPGEGPFEFNNRLILNGESQLSLALLDPTGEVVATGIEIIDYQATTDGTYQLEVSANSRSGEYYIDRDIHLAPTRFDFGDAASPVLVDWTQADIDAYDADRGYGWIGLPRGMQTVEFSRGNALTGDGIQVASRTFVVDVQDGTYDIDFHFGFSLHADDVRITIEDQAHVLTPQANQVSTFQTTVTDGQLTINMNGNFGVDSLLRLAGLEYREVTNFGFAGSVEPMKPFRDPSVAYTDIFPTTPNAFTSEELTDAAMSIDKSGENAEQTIDSSQKLVQSAEATKLAELKQPSLTIASTNQPTTQFVTATRELAFQLEGSANDSANSFELGELISEVLDNPLDLRI